MSFTQCPLALQADVRTSTSSRPSRPNSAVPTGGETSKAQPNVSGENGAEASRRVLDPEEKEQEKWTQWDEQQKRFRQELEEREEKEDQKWLDARMARLQKELREIDQLAPGAKKSRLRKLQLELHPDKQPERIRVKAQQLFLLVQGKWEANEAVFQRDSQRKSPEMDRAAEEAAARAAAAKAAKAREEREKRREEERAKEQERQREREKEEERERKEQEKAREEEKRRKNAESRAKQAEEELKRFKEAAAARQRMKQDKQAKPETKQSTEKVPRGPERPKSASDHNDFAAQSDSPILSTPGQKENAPPNKDVETSIHIRLRINGVNSTSSRPTLSAKSTATVGSLRELLEDLTKIPVSLQKLQLGEREVFDFETLRGLVKSGNMLDLNITEVPQKGEGVPFLFVFF